MDARLWRIFALLFSLTSATAYAQGAQTTSTVPGWPLKVGASVWTRYELRDNYDKLGVSRGRFQEGDFAVYRARLTLATSPIDIGKGQKVTIAFSPQADGFWGNQPSTISNPNLGVYEAYLRLENRVLRADVGHFSMNYGDALVIGDLRWHQTARSFDGARIRIAPSKKYWIDTFFTQLDEGLPRNDDDFFAGDVFFTGVYASVGRLLSDSTTLEPYFLTQIWTTEEDATPPGGGGPVTRRPAVQATMGIRALQTAGIFDFRLETGLQFGRRRVAFSTNPEVLAFQFDAEVGFKPVKGLRLSLEGLFASGDDPETTDKVEGYDELFPTTHKFLGLADVIGIRTNIASVVFHIAYTGLESWVFKIDFHAFIRPETADGQESFAGVENDINVVYKIGKGMTLRAMYAVFGPGSDHFFVEGQAANDAVHYLELQYGYAF